MSRTEFSAKTKAKAFLRANGVCEGERCAARLTYGKFHYDHDLACELGGDNSLDNCRVLCVVCHKQKTKQDDMPKIAKGRRIRQAERGIKKPRTIRAWRKFNGDPVYAGRGR